ncbi:M48 family metallopeptidase [Epibacterium sp. MM17-32]|uniref:M48 family metallopeptidase n=1 Tax=Epibacterium sp. MM17-32 TaxID=2917734 RepID=UPI001EF3EC90|nr:M48 family metallopeptidase [Epibacterium sp. MM17-32]MCG7627658.1 M48 family metallopeptidase [Epibacterium sp. MM17-32]
MTILRFSRVAMRSLAVGGALLLASACGTTYQLPDSSGAHADQARAMFAAARNAPRPAALSAAAAEARFARVAPRIARTGRSTCQQLTADRPGFNCDVDIAIDRDMKERNAYFTYQGKQPLIRISLPLIRDTASDDEVAFVLAHEYGHLIGRHIEKQQQQVLAGALLVGAIAGVATAAAGDYDGGAVELGLGVGAAAGSIAYSKAYELESDTLGTRIADAAGYDPVEGAKFFARAEPSRGSGGGYSFWGTHPPDEKRVATVLATKAEIDAQQDLRRAQ